MSRQLAADSSNYSTSTGLLIAALVTRMLDKVQTFNTNVRGVQIPATPRSLDRAEAHRAVGAIGEEITEFCEAVEAQDPLEQADALLDMVFFALGRLVEMGIPAWAVMQEISRANNSKEPGALSKRPGWNGRDAVKPEGWRGPDHSWLLTFSLQDLEKARKWDALPETVQRIAKIATSKGGDYNNIAGGRDAYFPFGHLSYAQVLHMKAARIQSLINAMAVGKEPNHEGIADSIDDLLNYGVFYREAIAAGKVKDVPAHFSEVQA
jgi:predicted HAD superfamily Cof-like phosphohydrolase